MAEAFQPDALVKQLLNDPALLKNAMQMANVLAQSGVLDHLAADIAGDKTEPAGGFAAAPSAGFAAAPPAGGFAAPPAGGFAAPPDGSAAASASGYSDAPLGAMPSGGAPFGRPNAGAEPAPVLLPAGVVGGNFGRDIRRHKKLLEALSLYMEGERKEKLEFVIRLLEILELAGGLKG